MIKKSSNKGVEKSTENAARQLAANLKRNGLYIDQERKTKGRPMATKLLTPESIVSVQDKTDINGHSMPRTTQSQQPFISCFTTMSGNEWMKKAAKMENPRQLFGTLVLENEITMLFSLTNMGKSILAVQICDCISRAMTPPEFSCELSEGLKCLYVDFELSTKQFERRFLSCKGRKYKFSNNFKRAELISTSASTNDILQGLKSEIIRNESKFVCIDNLTFISGNIQKAAETTELLKGFRTIQKETGATFLIIGHTPKKKSGEPITINDLAGTARLGDFIDSAFAIGKSASGDIQYLKQVKVRSCENSYDSSHVVILEKVLNNKLEFEVRGFCDEETLLHQKVSTEKRDEMILSLAAEGKSCRAIAEELGCSKSTVNNIIKLNKMK